MIKIEINDKTYKLPESFKEMTLYEYCKVFKGLDTNEIGDELQDFRRNRQNESIMVSRLLGEDDDFCLSLPFDTYARIQSRLGYLYDISWFMKNARSYVDIDFERYSIPPVEKMSLRQFIDADMVMKESESDTKFIDLLSVLLLKKGNDGEYIEYNGEYENMREKVKNLPCDKALCLVYHFFKLQQTYKNLSQVSTMVEGENL